MDGQFSEASNKLVRSRRFPIDYLARSQYEKRRSTLEDLADEAILNIIGDEVRL